MKNTVFCPFISHIDDKITGFIVPGGENDKREKNIIRFYADACRHGTHFVVFM